MLKINGRTHSEAMHLLSEALQSEGGKQELLSKFDAIREVLENAPYGEALDLDGSRQEKNNLASFSNRDIDYLNTILPWSSYVVDHSGRIFGNMYTSQKRSTPERLADPRITRLASLVENPDSKKVIEYGCFEGNHSAQLCQHFGSVLAIDGRIENCVKTLLRCWMLGQKPDVSCVNLEEVERLEEADLCCHIGVLYHLSNALSHLWEVFAKTKEAVLLDTQVARQDQLNETLEFRGNSLNVYKYIEMDIAFAPFAGMRPHAIWLLPSTIIDIAEQAGFKLVEKKVVEQRNGDRGRFYFKRS
ncbi:MAG: hypothetical protein AAF437_03710 [Pseudomonadota bacterium]